ncbi:MAG: TMEM175 family protein [Pseudomonadota bacterium]
MRAEITKHLDHDPEFEWRGQSVSRIENLSDIVFALALGMLLLTGAPPQTYSELLKFLVSIVPVAAGFTMLFMIWNAHFVFFRRYALADNTIVAINSVMLLAVLFIAYPLRFIFESFFWYIFSSITGDFQRLQEMEIGIQQAAESMAIFASGYAVIYLLLSLMYNHAFRKADLIGLSTQERKLTRVSVWFLRGQVGVALLVAICAYTTPLGPFAGFLMILNWPSALLLQAIFNRN